MKILILAGGRLRSGPEKPLAEAYEQRITLPLTVREIDTRARRDGPAGRAEVEERFIKALPKAAHIILLDETGPSLTSRDFAARLKSLFDSGDASTLVLVIGGPDGHGPRLRGLCHEMMSMGRATWPHMLARVMILEQLYRAQSIWAGSPYHRD